MSSRGIPHNGVPLPLRLNTLEDVTPEVGFSGGRRASGSVVRIISRRDLICFVYFLGLW